MTRAVRHLSCASLLLFIFFGSSPACRKKTTSASTAWTSQFETSISSMTDALQSDLTVHATKDTSGNYYFSGTLNNSWVVMKSSDGGETWNQEFSYGFRSQGFQIASDSLGNVFAVGGYTPSTIYSGVVKKYNSTTLTWSDSLVTQAEAGKPTYFTAVAIDSSDNIYVAGSANITLLSPDGWPDRSVYEWIVLKSSDHGATWNLVDTFYPDDHFLSVPTGILIASSGSIYVYGAADTTSFIRKSADQGASWTRLLEDTNTLIRSMAEWNGGFIIGEDYFEGGASPSRSRIRGTTDDFAHLKQLDSYQPAGTTDLVTGGMKVDTNRYVYYTGRYVDADGVYHLYLRGTRGNDVWQTIDDYSAASSELLYANDVFIDDTQLYNVGVYIASGGQASWLLRSALITSTQTFTPSSMASGTDLVSPVPAGAKRIFMTSQSHDGAWGVSASSAIVAADSFCNSDPNKPLVGASNATYKALMVNPSRVACTSDNCSISGAAENTNWVLSPSTAYVSREGATLGTTDSAGIFTTFDRALVNNTVYLAWTGLEGFNRLWIVDNNADNCQDWTTNDSSYVAPVWTPRGTVYGDIYSQFAYYGCDSAQRLLCVEQ